MSDSLVIIPTYNESQNIGAIVEAIFNQPKDFHIIIVDDSSPDGTSEIVEQLIKTQYPGKLFLMKRPAKSGLGTAYIDAFHWGLERQYDFFFEMDADFSHNPEDLIRLYKACNNGYYDVSIGSRYIKGGRIDNWPVDRKILSYGASLYVRLITWMPVLDPTAGFICYTRKVLESLDLTKIKFIGYAFQIEMKFASRSLGFKLVEIPITFKDREKGESKITRGIVKEAVFGVFKMAFFYPFKNYSKVG